jgi:TPR repeat protein
LGAEAGDSGAQTNLGYMYDRGLGVAPDTQTAFNWYRKAADKGEALAKYNLGDMYLRGDGVAQDDTTAFHWFQLAAAQGQSGASIKLGYMFAEGRGTRKDAEAAYAWVAAASLAGDQRGEELLRSLESRLTREQLQRAQKRSHDLRLLTDQQLRATLQP